MTFGPAIWRLRAGSWTDPVTQRTVLADWENPSELLLTGASVSQSSTSSLNAATREQAIESKSLFCSGDLDVKKGDRIRVGDEGGPVYSIDGIPPAADTNPFTGWTPNREIPLTRAVG